MTGTSKKTDATSPKAKTSPTKKDTQTKKDTPTKKVSPTKDSPTKKDKSPAKEDLDAATQALSLFAQGKRHLLVNDINSAVESLQEACRMLAEQHGETATECGDAYFYYGRALLELSRIESGVLGNALDGVPEGEDLDNSQVESPDKLPVEEKEKVAEQVGEALEKNFKTLEKASSEDDETDEPMEDEKSKDKSDAKDKSNAKGKSDKEEKADSAMDTDTTDKGSDDETEEDDSQEDGEGDDTGEEEMEDEEKEGKEKDGEGEKTEEADDVSNLQLAWEMLELAKVIYQRQAEGDKTMSLKTAQVFLKLGEVCLENENYPQSIEDFQSCLKLQETHMEADDRCLAETHYQLGVAHSFSDEFDKAIESFTKALKIIQDRIANLEKTKKKESEKQKDAKTKDDSSDSEDSEVQELILLIPEIKEKITDMEEMKKETKDKINKVKKELGMASAIGGSKEIEETSNSFGASNTSNDAKPIETAMIRKKRKPEDEAGDEPKKTKAVNGEAKPSENGAKNGKSPKKMDEKSTSDTSKGDLKTKAAEDMDKKTKELKKQTS